MTTPCPPPDPKLVANRDMIINAMKIVDTGHDMAQGRQDAAYRPASRAAVAAHANDNPNDAMILPPGAYNLVPGPRGLEVHPDIQTALNGAISNATGGVFTSIGGDRAGQSYEQKGDLSLFEPPMQVTVQELMRDSQLWSSLSKPERTASAHVWLTGYRNPSAKEQDEKKKLYDYYNSRNVANIPIGTLPILANPMTCWGSVNITWDPNPATAATNPDGIQYYSFDVYKNSNLLRIANFMMTFMFPETPVERGGFVIDGGGAGCLRAIDALPQITAIICPAVVGDSAPLCPHNIGGRGKARNAYSFADVETADIFLEKSNLSSNGFVGYTTRFYYQRNTGENGIYDKNTYSTFNYVIEVTGNDINVPPGVFQFTQNGPSMGPSVPYIAALIHAARSNAGKGYDAIIDALSGVTPSGSVLSLGTFPGDLFTALKGSDEVPPVDMNIALQLFERICFDIKRCGDWEQVESVPAIAKQKPEIGVTMLGTGDILCMSRARLRGVCGIWHNEKSVGKTEGDNNFGSGGNPEAWDLLIGRVPQNVNPNISALFDIRDIVGKLQKPLEIIASKCLDTTVERLRNLSSKCTEGQGIQSLCPTNDPAKALSAINLSNVARKCEINIQLLSPQEVLPEGFNINNILAGCRGFSSEFNPGITAQEQAPALAQFVGKYRPLLDEKPLADAINPYIEMITTALYSFGCSYESVTNLCENAEEISDEELDTIFGEDATLPVNPDDGTINLDFVINDAFGYFAGWHKDISDGRAAINGYLQPELLPVDDTDASSVADLVEHFNTNVLGPLKTIMSSRSPYSIAISRIVAASDDSLIKQVNKNYKLKSLADIPVPSRVSGGRRAVTPEQLQAIVQKVVNTRTKLREWFVQGNAYSADLCGEARKLVPTNTPTGAAADGTFAGGASSGGAILSNDDYSDAIQNYFDMLIQEVMGYLKLCENGDPGSPLQLEGFRQASDAFCKGTARNAVDRQLANGPQLPLEQVGLLDQYYDDTRPNIMSFFRSQFNCRPGVPPQENINRCIEVRKALEALWSYDAATIRKNAIVWLELNDYPFVVAENAAMYAAMKAGANEANAARAVTKAATKEEPANAVEAAAKEAYNQALVKDGLVAGNAFINRAIYSVIDPNTNIPRAFHQSEWQRDIFGGNVIIGRAAGAGSFHLLSPYWHDVFQIMFNPDLTADPIPDLVEFIEDDIGLYDDNYSDPYQIAISEYINELLPLNEDGQPVRIDFELPQGTQLPEGAQLPEGTQLPVGAQDQGSVNMADGLADGAGEAEERVKDDNSMDYGNQKEAAEEQGPSSGLHPLGPSRSEPGPGQSRPPSVPQLTPARSETFVPTNYDPGLQQALYESYQQPAKRRRATTAATNEQEQEHYAEFDLHRDGAILFNLFNSQNPVPIFTPPINEPYQLPQDRVLGKRGRLQPELKAYGGRKKKMTKKRNKKKKMTKKKGKGKKNGKKKMTKKHNKKKKKTRARGKGKGKKNSKGRKAAGKKSGGAGVGDDLVVPFSKLNV